MIITSSITYFPEMNRPWNPHLRILLNGMFDDWATMIHVCDRSSFIKLRFQTKMWCEVRLCQSWCDMTWKNSIGHFRVSAILPSAFQVWSNKFEYKTKRWKRIRRIKFRCQIETVIFTAFFIWTHRHQMTNNVTFWRLFVENVCVFFFSFCLR